jgi:hypothetical protein
MQAGSILKLIEKGIKGKGDARALNLLLTLAARYNDEPPTAPANEPLSADDEAILADYLARRSKGAGD